MPPLRRSMTCSICGGHAPCDDLQDHRPAVVPTPASSAGPGAPVRAARARPRRHRERAAVLGLRRPTRRSGAPAPAAGSPGGSAPAGARAAACARLRDLLGGPDGEDPPRAAGAPRHPGGPGRPATVLPGWARAPSRGPARARRRRAAPHPRALDELPRQAAASTCARPGRHRRHCRPAMSRWPGWNAGSPRPSPDVPAPASASCCTGTPSGTSCAGSAAGWPRSTPPTASSCAAQRNIRAAIALLDWLDRPRARPWRPHGRATSTHGWPRAGRSTASDGGNFVRWARRHKLTPLDFAAVRWGGPAGVIDTETRWEQARWLLHDDSLKPEDRLAGLLVLLYAQRTSVISRLTLRPHPGRGRPGPDPARPRAGRLPRPLAALATASRRNPPRPRRHRRPRHLALAVPRRPARPADQRRPAGRAPAPARHPRRARPAPPRCSSSPPTCPPPSWPACSASTSASPSPGNEPAAGDWAAYAADVSRRDPKPTQTHDGTRA